MTNMEQRDVWNQEEPTLQDHCKVTIYLAKVKYLGIKEYFHRWTLLWTENVFFHKEAVDW